MRGTAERQRRPQTECGQRDGSPAALPGPPAHASSATPPRRPGNFERPEALHQHQARQHASGRRTQGFEQVHRAAGLARGKRRSAGTTIGCPPRTARPAPRKLGSARRAKPAAWWLDPGSPQGRSGAPAAAARTATTAQGSAAARVASQTRIQMRGRAARLPATPLPTAVQASQHASTSPTEISFPRKSTISSRSSTTWAMAAVKPIWTASARIGDPALTPPGLDAASSGKSKRPPTRSRAVVRYLRHAAKWRNWQTQRTQNPSFFTERVGSTPTFATIKSFPSSNHPSSSPRRIGTSAAAAAANEKARSYKIGLLWLNRATSYSPTHLRAQYHRG